VTAGSAAERVRELMGRLAEELQVPATVEVRDGADEIRGEYRCDDPGPLIGRHGQLIDAIGHLAYRMAFAGADERRRVVVDADGYRGRREQSLRRLADQAAAAAVATGRAIELEPMGAGDRRVVHEHLKARHDVETYSRGQEPTRRLVVAPVVQRELA